MRKVSGIGVFTKGVFKSNSPEYTAWRGMLRRCYDPIHQLTAQSYVGCTVSEEFLDFQQFADWLTQQAGYGKGWQLDKDLLLAGNKIYGRDTCVLLPPFVNKSIVVSARGELPNGVERHGPSYRAYWNIDGKRYKAGPFATVSQAFEAYKTGKETVIREVAERYKGVLDVRAYTALACYTIGKEQAWGVN